MLTLYYKPSCPFCQRVLEMAENLNVELELKDTADDAEAQEELIQKGGKKQVPFLVDDTAGVSMYESNDIIDYMRENRTSATQTSAGEAKPRVHVSNATCESCEG